MADLKSAKLMYLKAALFVVIGAVSAGILFLQAPTLQNAILLALVIWSFCRAYYFAFYVIEHYIDASYRFAGLSDFLSYALRRRRISRPASSAPKRAA